MKIFSITKYRGIFVGLSGALMVVSIGLVMTLGLNWGIDFTGGSLLQVSIPGGVAVNDLRSQLAAVNQEPVSIQVADDGSYFLRYSPMNEEDHQATLGALKGIYSDAQELKFESVGPSVGAALEKQSTRAVVVLMVLIAAYIAWAFRHVSKPVPSWQYGLVTAVAALHDVVLPLGVFAVLGRLYGYQVDTAFVAAILTILGYSINDTIVVFDRTRENLQKMRNSGKTFAEIIDQSVMETLGRSINTTLTTLLPLVAIAIFGGSLTRPFVIALMVGIISGAYSSIFLASPLLTYFVPKKS